MLTIGLKTYLHLTSLYLICYIPFYFDIVIYVFIHACFCMHSVCTSSAQGAFTSNLQRLVQLKKKTGPHLFSYSDLCFLVLLNLTLGVEQNNHTEAL